MGVDSEEDREMILAKVYELFSQDTEAYDNYDDIEGNDVQCYCINTLVITAHMILWNTIFCNG